MKKNKLPLIIIGLILIGGIIFTYLFFDYKKSITSSVSDSEELIDFDISEGQSTKDIAANLQESGLVKSSVYFEIYVRQNNLGQNLQAGKYTIPANVTLEELAEILQTAYEQDVWVTIPEGYRVTEVADLLEEEFSEVTDLQFIKEEFLTLAQTGDPIINAGLIIPDGKTCEGFLFPDTYRFSPDSTAQQVIDAMISNFKVKIYDEYENELSNSKYNLYEVITLASIVEREAIFEDDRGMVADILERRLEINWALEVDVSLLYYFEDWKYELTTEDLQTDTLYNTRLYTGLTPTPICNPGESAITAVLSPTSNNYWYFVSDNDGDLHYGETLDEHNSNIQQYMNQ